MAEDLETRSDENFGKFVTDNTLATISSIVLDQSKSGTIDVRDRSTEDTAMEIITMKSAISLAMNLDKISNIDKKTMVEESMKEEMMKKEEETITPISDVEPKRLLQGEDLIKYKKRGTIFQPRPSIFRLPEALIVTDTSSIESHRKPIEDKQTSISELSIIRKRYEKSENIAVLSMQIDMYPTSVLSLYEAKVIACILKECVDHLAVLRYAIPAEINDLWDDIVKPINKKYDVSGEPHRIFRIEANLPPLTLSVAEKLQRERTYVHKILNDTLDEIKRFRRFETLEQEVNNIAGMLEGEHNLEENCAIWENQVNQLQQLIKDESNRKEREKRELLELAQITNGKVDDTVYEIALKMGYVENWEKSRLHQQKFKHKVIEQNLLDELNEYRKEQSLEEIVIGKMCTYFEKNIKDMENEMFAWSNRYDNEIERRQREIDDLKAKVEEQKIEIQDLRVMKDEREAIINANLAEMKRLEEEAKYQATLDHAATIIQSVWRGYMVRHQLGEYKDLRIKLRKRKKLAAARKKKLKGRGKKLKLNRSYKKNQIK
ncbi:hypothetical protein M0802_006449 [Mischocyttarus mexicanus]|nr:hypothetical protein M0802_006449 [Mischocyttarus mexicanus]